MRDIGIVIPVYKIKLSGNEEKAFLNCLSKVRTYPIILIAPSSLDTSWYEEKGQLTVKRFKDKFFKSERSYSKLLLTPNFYQAFQDYRYILIVQTDVWILQNDHELKNFINSGYDYIGAPWKQGILAYAYTIKGIAHFPKFVSRPQELYVGNGGLSLRKVDSHLKLLKKYRLKSRLWSKVGEDIFFSYYGQRDSEFVVAPVEIAESFSLETSAREDMQSGISPFGVHAWEKYYPEIIELDCKKNN